MDRLRVALIALVGAALAGCYHFEFVQNPPTTTLTSSDGRPVRPKRLVTYTESVPTYLNGFVGTGKVDTSKYCARPIRTDLRVTSTDVFVSFWTLLIYTPHTLSVTCEVPA